MEELQNTYSESEAAAVGPSSSEAILEPQQPKRKKGGLKRIENLVGWVYISPMIVGILVFTTIPLFMSIASMFYNWNGIKDLFSSDMVAFDNFKLIFGGMYTDMYWKAFGNTFLFAIQLPVCLFLSLFLAVAMNRDMRGVQVFRVIYYLPGVMSIVAVAIVWQKLFNNSGTINQMFGLSTHWLEDDATVVFVVNLLLVWKGLGYTTLMLIAGLQSVSTDQLEAARIDGANWWIILIKITMPALYPIIFYLFVTGLMGALQMFNEPFILLGGYGLDNNGMTAVSFVYYFRSGDHGRLLGLSAVGAWVLAFFIFIVTAIQMYVDKRKREAE